MNIRIAVLILTLVTQATGQRKPNPQSDAFITMGGMKLELGMAQDTVIAHLADQFTLRKKPGSADAVWMVFPKVTPPFEALASLSFNNGKLAAVLKYWGPADQQEGVKFAGALYAVLGELTKDNGTCVISNRVSADVSFEAKAIFITCGDKYVRIDITRTDRSGESAEITEVLDGK
jgi:hypothetical protein